MGVLLAEVLARGGNAGMIKPPLRVKSQPETVNQNAAHTSTQTYCAEVEDDVQPDSVDSGPKSMSTIIAAKLKERLPIMPTQTTSPKRLTVGLRQTLRSASGTLRKLTYSKESLHTSEQQVVQEVLSHRRLSRKKF